MKVDHDITEILNSFKDVLKQDYERYHNHAMRVYQCCLLLDDDLKNAEKYAYAAAFHDIGIWTDQTFDYINPSVHQALLFLREQRKEGLVNEVSEMIYWHHKVTRYTGEFFNTVENFRRADWIDVSLGMITFGSNRKQLKSIKREYPLKGFHLFLIRKSVINFLKHPLKPLPMFKR